MSDKITEVKYKGIAFPTCISKNNVVGQFSPKTDDQTVLEEGAGAAQANGSVVKEPTMDLDQVARAIVHMASLPLDTNVLFMTIMATKMPFVGRG